MFFLDHSIYLLWEGKNLNMESLELLTKFEIVWIRSSRKNINVFIVENIIHLINAVLLAFENMIQALHDSPSISRFREGWKKSCG